LIAILLAGTGQLERLMQLMIGPRSVAGSMGHIGITNFPIKGRHESTQVNGGGAKSQLYGT